MGENDRSLLIGLAMSLLVSLLPASAAGQVFDEPHIWVRGIVTNHIAGLELRNTSGEEYGWRHRAKESFGVGATISVPVINAFGLRLDGDYVPELDLEADEDGPALHGKGAPAYWLTASLWVAPQVVCGSVCLSASAGYGLGGYDFPQQEARGHIWTSVAESQTTGVFRLGLDLRVWKGTPSAAVQVADYIGDVDPFYSGEDLSPMHLLVVGIALGV